MISWDRKAGDVPTTLTGANTLYIEQSGRPRWFQWARVSATSHKFYNTYTDTPANNYAGITRSLATNASFSIKAVSTNFRCALIYDLTVTATLKTYDFSIATPAPVDEVTASLYTGIDLTLATTAFAVSDDCTAMRINNVIIHKASGTLYADTLPTGVTVLANPVFTPDFSLLVTDTAVYYYTARSGATAGFYTLDTNQTFYDTKRIERIGNNYLVYSQKVTNTTLRDWKIQFFTITNSLSTKFG